MLDDVIPMDQFALKWRFTDPLYNLLPADVLARIHPRGPRASRDIYERMRPIVKNYVFNQMLYPIIDRHDSKANSDETRQWLKVRLADQMSNDVAISWGPETAVTTRVGDFCNYWDDFCYPGSDDVIVLPDSGEWALYYFHEEQIILGRRAL